MRKEETDEELLGLAIRNPLFFGILIDRYEEKFLRKSKNILKNEDDARDAVQDTFVKIYLKAKTFKKRKGASFSSWGYAILLNTCYTIYKKKKRASEFAQQLDNELLDMLPNNFEEEFSQKMYREEIMAFLIKLPDIFQSVSKKFYMEGKSQKEIAIEERVSLNVVRTRLHRARKEMKKMIDTGKALTITL